jgi:hypothetical protein
MSEHLAAAAAAMKVPESMVKRSAEAKAKATGTSVDEILAAWAGGESAPSAPAPAAEAPEATPEPHSEPTPEPAVPGPDAQTPTPAPAPQSTPTATPATPARAAAVMVPASPPVLEGRPDRPLLIMFGAVAALSLALLAGLVYPSTPAEGNGVFSSAVPLSAEGLAGRDVYRSLGCGSCHTAIVRPLAIDAGLGPVTIDDSNQELGYRRLGPDLANVANRVEDGGTFASVLAGAGGHPAFDDLSDEDVRNLVEYLSATNFTPEADPDDEAAPAVTSEEDAGT